MTTNILVLESNPQGTSQLRLNQEIREIDDALERGNYAEEFILQPRLAVRVEDLQHSIQRRQARIVHFCGHGTASQGLVLQTTSGEQKLLDTQAIADLFKLFKNQVECVVLNACYSQEQAHAIHQHINYVIGTKREIKDDAAIAFSQGFYQALADGESIERAYEFGCNRIQLKIYGSSQTERKLVPAYSQASSKWVDLPQHEVIELLIKKPLNSIDDSSSSLITERGIIIQRPFIASSPYKGLKRFNAQDKDLFFGRDRLIYKLIDAVHQNNLLLVLGASGSGKSSVIRAGVIPQLEGFAEEQYQTCLFTPNRDPFESLQRSLLNPEKEYDLDYSDVGFIPEGKEDTLDKTINLLKSKHLHWLIFIDQFEELFTICADLETRRNFIQGLTHIVQGHDKSVKLILAMRSDFLEELGTYPQFARIAQRHINLVSDMQVRELRQAIEQPAAQHGVVFESGLVQEIIEDVQGQAGSLPLLQYTLNLLWQQGDLGDRTLNIFTYRNLGGVSGALQKQVNQIYEHLPSKQQLATKQILLRLVDVVAREKSEILRTAVSRRAYKSDFTEAQIKTVNLLINNSLLISDDLDLEKEGQSTVEIAHEALLTSWTELKDWINEARETISLNNRLAEDSKRWQELTQENPQQANEELWSGSKLEKAIELRRDGTFEIVLGGLSDLTEDFIDTSINERDRQKQQELKQARKLAFLGITTAVLAVISLMGGGYTWWQQQLAWQREREYHNSLEAVFLDTNDAEILEALPKFISEAKLLKDKVLEVEKQNNPEDVDKSLAFYRQLLRITNKFRRDFERNPENVNEEVKNNIKQIRKWSSDAGLSLGEIINTQRLPELESELEKCIDVPLEPDLPAEAIAGNTCYAKALKIIHTILATNRGAGADLDGNARIDTPLDAEQMPCNTLKKIQDIWYEQTNNRCGWYGQESENDFEYYSQDCQELNGYTLTNGVFYNYPAGYALKRLDNCGMKPTDMISE